MEQQKKKSCQKSKYTGVSKSQPPKEELSHPPKEEPSHPLMEEPLHQSMEEPSHTPKEEPSHPPMEEPSHPPMEEPSHPLMEEPSHPPMEEPSHPPMEEPSHPPMEEPSHPPMEEPSHPPMEGPSHPPMEEPSHPSMEEPSHTPIEERITVSIEKISLQLNPSILTQEEIPQSNESEGSLKLEFPIASITEQPLSATEKQAFEVARSLTAGSIISTDLSNFDPPRASTAEPCINLTHSFTDGSAITEDPTPSSGFESQGSSIVESRVLQALSYREERKLSSTAAPLRSDESTHSSAGPQSSYTEGPPLSYTGPALSYTGGPTSTYTEGPTSSIDLPSHLFSKSKMSSAEESTECPSQSSTEQTTGSGLSLTVGDASSLALGQSAADEDFMEREENESLLAMAESEHDDSESHLSKALNCVFNVVRHCFSRCRLHDEAALYQEMFKRIGTIDMEISFRYGEDFNKHMETCTRKDNHQIHKAIQDFEIKDLPRAYQNPHFFQHLKNLAAVVALVTVEMVSPGRPKSDPLHKLRPINLLRAGTGIVEGYIEPTELDLDSYTCPCPQCEASDSPQTNWTAFTLSTVRALVYDDFEAEKVKARLNFEDGTQAMLYGFKVMVQDNEGNNIILCCNHDANILPGLINYIGHSNVLGEEAHAAYLNSPGLLVMMSYLHGLEKCIAVTQRFMRLNNQNINRTEYFYVLPTCHGCCGAPLFVFGNRRTYHERNHHLKFEGEFGRSRSYEDLQDIKPRFLALVSKIRKQLEETEEEQEAIQWQRDIKPETESLDSAGALYTTGGSQS